MDRGLPVKCRARASNLRQIPKVLQPETLRDPDSLQLSGTFFLEGRSKCTCTAAIVLPGSLGSPSLHVLGEESLQDSGGLFFQTANVEEGG